MEFRSKTKSIITKLSKKWKSINEDKAIVYMSKACNLKFEQNIMSDETDTELVMSVTTHRSKQGNEYKTPLNPLFL